MVPTTIERRTGRLGYHRLRTLLLMTYLRSALAILTLVFAAAEPASAAASARQTNGRLATPVPATPQNAASFVGDWTITTSGPSLRLTVTVIDGAIVGEVTTSTGAYHATLKIAGASLLAGYDFEDQGVSSDAVLTLTPNENEKRVDAHVDFANGAPRVTGTAARREQAGR